MENPQSPVLLDFGFDLNKVTGERNLLRIAVLWQQMTMTRYLLEQGANGRHVYAGGASILHFAIRHQSSRLPLVQLLVSFGADVQGRTLEGWHLVHRAAFRGNLAVLDYLLHEAGLNRTALASLRSKKGATPWLLACASERSATILPYFLAGYAGPVELGQQDYLGQDCRALLSQRGHVGMAWEVENLQAFPQRRYTFAQACMHHVNQDLLSLLLRRGANIDDVGRHGRQTCLLHAIRHRQPHLLTFLLRHGAAIGDPVQAEAPEGPASLLHCLLLPARRPRPSAAYLATIPLLAAAATGEVYLDALLQAAHDRGIDILQPKWLVQEALHIATAAFQLRAAATLHHVLVTRKWPRTSSRWRCLA